MNNLWLLTKINLLTFFNLGKIKSAKNGKEKRMAIAKVLLVLLCLFIFVYYLYLFVKKTIPAYIALGTPYLILVQFFVLASVFTLFTSIFKINGLLFNFKDYDLLMSMPIKKSIIITSKLVVLYLSNMIYVLLFMLPAYVGYISNVSQGFSFHLLFFITLVIIPIVPIIIATIIGSILTIISSRFKLKNAVNMILSIAFVSVIMIFGFKMENVTEIELANFGKGMVNLFNDLYPLTKMYLSIVHENNVLSLISFILIPSALFALYMVVINKYYDRINNNLSKEYTNDKFRLKDSKVSSPLMALYKKELKRYFSSYNYVLNTAMGAIMLTLSVFILIFFGGDKLSELGFAGLTDIFYKYAPIVLGSFCLLNCSTHSSISLEGKNLWIIKSLPVKPMTIFLSKIMVNLTILIPTIIINALALAIYLKAPLVTCIFMFITPLMYAFLISGIGIILNLLFPVFDWTSEIRVIKQSLASFIAILVAAIIAFAPFMIKIKLSNNNFVLLVTIIIIMLNILVYGYLKKFGEKKFAKL